MQCLSLPLTAVYEHNIHQIFQQQVRPGHADIRQHGAGPRGESHLLVLLRQGPLVLCGEEESIPRTAFTKSKLAEEGEDWIVLPSISPY